MQPVFVRPSATYPAYQDYWELVSLSGFQQIRPKDVSFGKHDLHIWSVLDQEMMELLHENSSRSSKDIFWNLERPDANLRGNMSLVENLHKANDEILDLVDAIWTPDAAIQALDVRSMIHAPLGSHPGLAKYPRNKRYSDHLCHMGQESPRRRAVLDKLRADGVSILDAGFGEQRERVLSGSSALLSIDRVEGLKVASHLRWAVAAAYHLPVVSERVSDPSPLNEAALAFFRYEDLLSGSFVMGRHSWPEYGRALHGQMCLEFPFRDCVLHSLGKTP